MPLRSRIIGLKSNVASETPYEEGASIYQSTLGTILTSYSFTVAPITEKQPITHIPGPVPGSLKTTAEPSFWYLELRTSEILLES